jgi:HPt (histidine-containing phosphotransfer) domain-containing protein
VRGDLDARLTALAARFRERALVDRTALSEIAALLEQRDDAAARREEVQQIAHRLAGAGGTFGYPEISASAAELDDLAASHPNGERLADGCLSLVREIDRAVGTTMPSSS